jgi:hypothetical protein
MERREVLGMMAVAPIVGLLPAVPTTGGSYWYLAFDGRPRPIPPRMVFMPFAGAYPGKPTWLPVSDRPLVLGEYAGFTVSGYRET